RFRFLGRGRAPAGGGGPDGGADRDRPDRAGGWWRPVPHQAAAGPFDGGPPATPLTCAPARFQPDDPRRGLRGGGALGRCLCRRGLGLLGVGGWAQRLVDLALVDARIV